MSGESETDKKNSSSDVNKKSVLGTASTPVSTAPKSMTGFARATRVSERCEIEVEIKAVNHRFLEVTPRLPRAYAQFERSVRALLQKDHRRGKLEVSVLRREVPVVRENDNPSQSVIDVEFDQKVDNAVLRYTRACERHGISKDHLGVFLAQVVSSIRSDEPDTLPDYTQEEADLLTTVETASQLLLEMREKEGAHLVSELAQRMRTVEVYRTMIQDAATDFPVRAQKKLTERIQQLLQEVQVDPSRIALEVAMIADRSDITEELTRLDSHFAQFRSTLVGSPEGIGRKLDFLMQEFGREFNTITSKAQDARIQGIVVDAKAELEKIREQIQNIE